MISFAASASNMENDTVEQARASNMEEDKASSPNKGKFIDVGNASDIEMATNIVEKLDTEARASNMEEEDKASSPNIVEKLDYEMLHMSSEQNSYEKRISPCCIYRVPQPLRNVNWEVYTPLLISIGPLHRGNKRLEAMEREKLKYFKKLTERNGMDKKKWCDIVISIKNQEERLRYCYPEKFKKIESSDFVEMILLDAVFIIQFFLESNDDTGPKHFGPTMTFDIREDLMLLENQLPLFIIQEIYDWATPHSQDAKAIPFLDLATRHFVNYPILKRVETSPGVEGIWHFTDLLRNLILSGAIERSKYILNPTMLKYSAVKLHKAGVRFDADYEDRCLVNIKFDKGVLKIPPLEVDHCFERRVRNIMAMELCLYKSEAYICSYIKFMEQLIDSAEDVGLLVHMGIIVHWLRDDDALSNILAMIKNLCENIGDNNTCFHDISRKLNEQYYVSLFNAESSNTEWDPNLRAKNKGKDKASTSSVSSDFIVELSDIETGNILARLQDKLVLTSQQDMTECCICRVPNSFRNVKPEAYTPQLISIGPLHSGDERLKGMEEQKWRYFKEFAERDGMNTTNIEDLVIYIQDKEAYIRACYSENFSEITSSDFIEMILLDAVFIIEFFQHSNDEKYQNLKPWMIFDIREDLMLLENQLPFFIIEEIHDKACHARQETERFSFLKLATVHFGKYLFSQGVQNTCPDVAGSIQNTDPDVQGVQNTCPDVEGSIQNNDPDDEEGSRHFTDLIRSFMLKGSIQRDYSFSPVKLKYNAVMLRQAGMKFQVTEDKCLVNITFEKGVLKIPRLEVDYCFERLVRNIMAFEQCFKPFKAYICNYIMFMDHLIDSAEDVDLLAENRIIQNLLGDDAALSDMMNKLCETIPDTYTCYDDICGKMNAYYENPWNHIKATLKLVYFPDIWRGTATVAAAILLILTFIQTIKAFL